MDLEFLLELPVITALLIIVAAIFVDALFGVFKSFQDGTFDIRKLPRFLATNILPYVGGLIVLAVVARYIGRPFEYIFYAVAMAVLAKYLAEIIDKIKSLFGIDF